MARFILRRTLGAIPVLILGCSIVFLVVFALPGDPISAIGGGRSLPESTRRALAAKYHVDDPLWRQLARFLGGIVRGDLGESIRTRRPVRTMLAQAVPVTMRVAVIGVALEAVIGSLAAIVAVVTKRRFVDALVTTATVALVAVPTFVLGSIMQFAFGVRWRLLPVAGLNDGWRSYVLPCTSLAAASVAYVARLLRVRLEDEMALPYVVTARSKGLSERGVTRHAVRNALPVVITFLGFDIATLLGGAIVTEIIFNINGVGTLVARAISQRDQIAIVGVSVVSIGVYVFVGIVVDIVVAASAPAGAGRMRRWRVRVVGLVASLLVAMALVPGLFLLGTPGNHDPSRCGLRAADGTLQHMLPPSGRHWFGTDQQGCDMLARTVHAARISLGIAAMAILTATVVGSLLGAVAGFARGRVDALITRSVEVFSGIPPIVFAVLVLSTYADDRPLWLVSVVLASVAVPSTAKIVRTAVREVAAREYIEAARASGARPWRVLVRHVGPNVAPVVLTYAFLGVGPAIGAETTLAFLGLSVDPPAAGWGVLVAEGLDHLRDRPNLLLIPGAFLIVTTLTFVTLGDLMERRLRPGSGRRSCWRRAVLRGSS